MKKIIKCFSLMLIVCLMCVNMIGCKKENTTEEKKDEYLMVSESESNGINFKMKRLSNVATQSVSDAVEIVATVSPSDAVNKNLNWTLSWKTSKSDSVTDYVTKSVSSDTLTCTLTYVKNFDTQIILKATSVVNSSVSATCTIDCYKRTSAYELKLAIDFDGPCGEISADEYGVFDFSNSYDVLPSALKDIYFDFDTGSETVTKVGTIDSSTTIKRYIKLSSELSTALKDKGITVNSSRFELVNGTSFNDIFTELCTINSTDNFKLALASTSNWFSLGIYISDNGESSSVISYQLKGFNYSASELNSISFNKTSVIF